MGRERKVEKKKERLSVRVRCELQSYGHSEKEREGG